MNKLRGFTLIELSIVLVIIGLIVGGVLVGRDLIKAAEIRAQIKQLATLSQGLSTFRGKFNAVPGDIYKDAALFGLTPSAAGSMRDDGSLEDQFGLTIYRTPDLEPIYFFAHLVEAKMIPQDFLRGSGCVKLTPGEPLNGEGRFYKMALNPIMGITVLQYLNSLWLYLGVSDCTAISSMQFDANGVMTPAQASSLDAKIDDGIPSTGTVLAYKSSTTSGFAVLDTIDITAAQCVTTAAATSYNLSNGTNQCRLLIKMP